MSVLGRSWFFRKSCASAQKYRFHVGRGPYGTPNPKSPQDICSRLLGRSRLLPTKHDADYDPVSMGKSDYERIGPDWASCRWSGSQDPFPWIPYGVAQRGTRSAQFTEFLSPSQSARTAAWQMNAGHWFRVQMDQSPASWAWLVSLSSYR